MGGEEDSEIRARESSDAVKRLALVNQHLSSSAPTRRRRRKTPKDEELPADHSDVLGQLSTLRSIAATPNTSNPGYIRQKQAGKLWVRERVNKLLDEGSFREVGSVSGTVEWKHLGGTKEEPENFTPSNNVQGLACPNL